MPIIDIMDPKHNPQRHIAISSDSLNEGLGSIVASRVADLARGFILKARPIIVLHNPTTDETVTIKLKRSLLSHSLSIQDSKGERVIAKSLSALILLTKALNQTRKYVSRGYIEI